MPEICGNRPVAIAGLQAGEKPLRNACSSWAPVSVSMTVRLPNGSTENISPQVISHGCSPAVGGAQLRSARRPPELVYAASTPGYLPRIASATMLPIADSNRRVGARLMSNCWVPMTLLRRTAVWALASSTIAWTSARLATPRFLATRVAVARPRDVAVADHQLGDRVAGAGVEPLGHGDVTLIEVGDPVGVAGEHEVHRRVLQLVDDADDRAVPRRRRGAVHSVLAEGGALMDHDDLDDDPELP